jgi:hypothetical protein
MKRATCGGSSRFLKMSLLEEELAVTEGGECRIVRDGDKGAAILAGKA